MNVVIKNQNTAYPDAQVYFSFKTAPVSGTINGQPNWWASPQAFGYLQSNSTYYDQYAAYLQTISSAYGYPFSDRWQIVQASLDPQTFGTMELDVLPDFISGFETWRSANFTVAELQNAAVSGPAGDATGAGIVNLVKYALGILPKRSGVAGLPTMAVQTIGGTAYLTYTYTCNPQATDATLAVQVSTDLAGWNAGTANTTEVSRINNADGTQTVTTRGNTSVTNASRQLMRLSVSLENG